MNNRLFSIQEAANILGVSTKTLRRWDQRGRFVPTRTAGNQRRYTQEQISKLKSQSSKLKNVSETQPLFSETETQKELKVKNALPSVLSSLPSGSFLKNHFLLKHKDEIELSTLNARGPAAPSPHPMSSVASSLRALDGTPSSRATPNASLKMGFVFASLILILSFAGAFALTKYDLVKGLTDKKEQFAKFINNLPQISFQIGQRNPNVDLSFVPPDIIGSVLAAETLASSLILNVNVPAVFVGPVSVGTASPSASAILDLTSENQGFLAPRMTTVQRDAIVSPATSLFVYNTDTNHYNMYNGTSWQGVFTAIGDSTTGEAFTEKGTSGTALYFYDADGRGKLTIANLSGARTYTLPDATGEVSLLGQTISNSELVNSKVTVTAGTNMTGGGEVSLGSSVTLTLKDSISLAGTLTAAGAAALNGNVGVGDAITDTITFTGRVAADSSLIPIGTTAVATRSVNKIAEIINKPGDSISIGNRIALGTANLFRSPVNSGDSTSPGLPVKDIITVGLFVTTLGAYVTEYFMEAHCNYENQ